MVNKLICIVIDSQRFVCTSQKPTTVVPVVCPAVEQFTVYAG